MKNNIKFGIAAISFLIIFFFVFQIQNILSFAAYTFSNKENLKLVFYPVNTNISSLAADPANEFLMRIEVRDSNGYPVPKAHVRLSLDKNYGSISPSDIRTDSRGEALVTYTPSTLSSEQISPDKTNNVKLIASIPGSNIKSEFSIQLQPPPIILIHGYQSDGSIFASLRQYLTSKGFECYTFEYKSTDGVVASAHQLEMLLQQQAKTLAGMGIQVNRFDLIAHSMGGLVARYYTSSQSYILNNNVRKAIYISVPHKGSVWASIGESYFNNQAIKDMAPESDLFKNQFPSLINKGLNSTIETGNILAQYDEVVSPDSASLEEWGIKTEIFNVGENNFTMDNLLSGNIIESANHKSILNNRKVFERIEEMLVSKLPYPAIRK